MASTYSWTAGSGLWTNPDNWSELTAPGSADTAGIASTTGFDVIFGPSSAATLNATGDVAFAGSGDFGSFAATGFSDAEIAAGGSITAATATLGDTVQIAGAGLAVTGALTLDFANINLYDHASLEAGSLVGASSGYAGAIAMDATSTAEIGDAGIAIAGTLAIDPNVTLNFDGSIYAPLLDQGTIVATGFVALYGPVTGTGDLVLGSAEGSLQLNSSVGNTITIDFAAAGEGLQLPGASADVVAAIITGFQAGDAIDTNIPGITGAVYTPTGAGLGTVALTANGATVETLTLAGIFSSAPFLMLPVTGEGQGELVLAANAAGTPSTAVTNPGSDAYSWNVTTGGDWATAANWTDTTTSGTATTAPGATNAVTISNSGSLVPILTGDGNAASLTETGIIALNGTFGAGGLTVGIASGFQDGTVELLPGSVLSAGTAGINDTMLVGSGGSFVVSGLLTVGDGTFFANLYAFDGGRVTAGSLDLIGNDIVATDANSAIVIGDADQSISGALEVSPGATITAGYGSTIDTDLVNNGTVVLNGNFSARLADSITGAVTGDGTLELGNYANIVPAGAVAASQTVDFTGTTATLDLTSTENFAAVVTGLTDTDEFLVSPSVADASLTAGTLNLTNAGGTLLQSLAVGGALAGNSFVVLPQPFFNININGTTPISATAVVLVAGTPQSGPLPTPPPGSVGGENFTWSASGGSDWDTPGNWGTSLAPGSLDTVNLDNGGGFSVITGAGNAAQVVQTAGAVLSGKFNFGTLAIDQLATGYGWIDVDAGATLNAGTASVTGGTLDVVGAGASVAIAGTLSLGSSNNSFFSSNITVADGGRAQIGSLNLVNNVDALQSSYLAVDATSVLEIGTLGDAAAGLLTVDAGSDIDVATNLWRVDAAVQNNGSISLTSVYGATIDGAVSGTGTLLIGSGSELVVNGSIAAGQTIAFAGTGATLALEFPTSATITGFATGDTIELDDTCTQASYTATGAGLGTVALSGDSGAGSLTFAGDYGGRSFLSFATNAAPPAAAGFTLDTTGVERLSTAGAASYITLAAACFAEGTRLDTEAGPVAIGHLRIGDLVRTARGELLPVRWIGHRRTDCRRYPRPQDVWPVRVQAHAFGPGCPRRTVFLSPDHAVHVAEDSGSGLLIPIRYLINGASIAQVETDRVTYWHVELPRHDILLADGLPSESYLDTGNRAAFDNGGPAITAVRDLGVASSAFQAN